MPQEQGGHAQNHDEAFRQATKVVVDDALRIDVLGPRIVAVLCDHTPASDKIRSILADAITREPAVRTAIEAVLGDLDTKRKSRWMDKAIGAVGGIAITILGGVGIYWLTHLPAPSSISQLPAANSVNNSNQVFRQ